MEEDGGLQLAEGKCQMGCCCINSSKMVEVHVKLLNKKKLLSAEAIIYDHTTPHHITSHPSFCSFGPFYMYIHPSTLLKTLFSTS